MRARRWVVTLAAAAIAGLSSAPAPAVSAPQQGEAEALNNQGTALARQGRYEEAARAFKRAIRLAPDFAVAYFNLGLAESRLGDHEAARRTLETAVKARPDYAAAWLQLGRTLLTLNRPKEGLQAFQMVRSLNSDAPEALYWLGVASWQLGDWAATTAWWEALLARHPDHGAIQKVWEDLPRAYHNLAASIRDTHPDEAASAYREALRLRPGYPDALYGLALLELSRGHPMQAAVAFRELLADDAGNVAATRGLARALAQQDSVSAAITLYRAALALDPGDLPSRYGLAEALLKNGDRRSARAQADTIVAAAPQDPGAYKFRAFVAEHSLTGRRYGIGFRGEAAVADYRRALALQPDDAEAYYNIGVICGRQEHWQRALEAFQAVMAIDSTHAGVRRWLPVLKDQLKTQARDSTGSAPE